MQMTTIHYFDQADHYTTMRYSNTVENVPKSSLTLIYISSYHKICVYIQKKL